MIILIQTYDLKLNILFNITSLDLFTHYMFSLFKLLSFIQEHKWSPVALVKTLNR